MRRYRRTVLAPSAVGEDADSAATFRLVARIPTVGEVKEFARFVEEQLPRLRSYVARMPGARGVDVDDLLQEALLRAYEARDRFESDEHAVNWICHVVRNLLVDSHRRRARRPVVPYADLDEFGEPAPDPAEFVAAAEQANLAVHAVARLSQPQRELLWEHAVDGVSYAEIARRTATPLATVRSHAHRARLAAMREFAKAGGALSALPALAIRPWRRFTHKLAGLPPTAFDALAAAGAAIVAVAMPIAVVPAVTDPASPTLVSTGPRAPVATSTTHLTDPHGSPSVIERQAGPRRPAAPPSTADPKELVQAVQTGTFSGTYSSDCTYAPRTGDRIFDNYDCRFSAVSTACWIKLRGATTTTTGCTIQLLPTDFVGIANGVDGLGVDAPARQCWNSGYVIGTLRFRTLPGAQAIDLPVQLVMEYQQMDVISKSPEVLALSGSFPFSCVASQQRNQVGFHGTLGA